VQGSRLVVANRNVISHTNHKETHGIFFRYVALVLFIVALVFVFKTINVVPQQHAWVVERLGKYHATLAPGLNIVVPFVDRIAYKHILKEIPLDVPPQVCITKDNTQLQVDGILYFQVTDAMRASYGASNYISGDHPAGADHAAFGDRQDGAGQDLRGARPHQHHHRQRDRRIGRQLGRQGAALRDQGPDAAGRDPALDAAPDHGRAREARADRGIRRPQAGADQYRQRRARSAIARSEGEKQASRSTARRAKPGAIVALAEASSSALRQVGERDQLPGGMDAVNLRVAEQYVDAFGKLAKTNNSIIVPANLGDMSGLIASALQIVKAQK
jgi:regulator of protease activity HflC (stomatin/prohibitin superfamily)